MQNFEENKREINLDGEIVSLDPSFLQFNDSTLSEYMQKISLYYDYFSSKCTLAEELYVNSELDRESRYDFFFLQGKKEEGLTEKASEAYARTQPEVKELQKKENYYKSAVRKMKEFLRALDKAHTMAQNRGYMIRKEMEKLNSDIYYKNNDSPAPDADIEDIIKQASLKY